MQFVSKGASAGRTSAKGPSPRRSSLSLLLFLCPLGAAAGEVSSLSDETFPRGFALRLQKVPGATATLLENSKGLYICR